MTDALPGQTVVVIGGSAGIGLETARLARAEGAEVILAARDPERLERAAREIDAAGTAAFDAADPVAVARFFQELPREVDHVMVTAGRPYYGLLREMDFDAARRSLDDLYWLAIHLAREAVGRVRPGGSLAFMAGTGGRHVRPGNAVISSMTAAMPALIAVLALEIAPIRVNLIAPGFVDTPLSADLLGEGLEARREQLRRTLPIGRVVGPGDVAGLAVHLMANTAVTGATYDIDGGQQLAPQAV
jgi:NAD(P)-dependent dehydrogenase (short-subunit alcohol dehydrogenase family)